LATDENWGKALRTAKRRYEQAHDTDLTYKGMGERLGVILGRDPIPHPTVRSWFVDGQEPDTFAVVRALATMLEVDVGTLLAPAAPEVPRQNVNQSAEKPKRGAVSDLEGGAVVPAPRRSAAAPEKKRRPA
jgi:hypothetical protein